MKNLFFAGCCFLIGLISCRKEDFGQKIDQITQIYIDSAGIDMFNSKIKGSYSLVQLNDVYGSTDNSPVSFTIKKDSDTLNYIEYISGAKRIELDSSNKDMKIYQSKIALNLTSPISSTTNVITHDTLKINYISTPIVFEIHQAWYNNKMVFSKIDGQLNIIKIAK